MMLWFQKKYDTCVPWTPKYPMGLTQVSKPMARTAFAMLSFQCLDASSLGQSMPHSCSLKDPMCFPFFLFFFNLRIHACNKNKITTFYRWQWKYLAALLSKIVPYKYHTAITISKKNVGSSTKSSKKQIQWTLWDHVIPSAFYSFHLISFNPNFKRPIPSQKVDP